jgi:hypothetical protein
MSERRRNPTLNELVNVMGALARTVWVHDRPVYGQGRGESPLKGVARVKDTDVWRAQIQLDLGRYANQEHAAAMYAIANYLLRPLSQRLKEMFGDLRDQETPEQNIPRRSR